MPSLKRLTIAFVSAVFLLGSFSVSLAGNYSFDVWTTANGLPQNTVTGVVQTPDGYLWLSTFDGLARFDGVKFTVFDKGNSAGIINNRFAGIFADRDGTVWAYTENGSLTVYRSGVFTSYATPEGLGEGIVGIRADADGNALIETTEHVYGLQANAFVPAQEQKEKGVRTVFYGRTGTKWIFESKRISSYQKDRVIVYPFELSPAELSSSFAVIPYEDVSGALWLRSGHRVARFLPDGVIKVYTEREIDGLAELLPYGFFEDSNGVVYCILSDYLASKMSKLVRFDSEKPAVFDLQEGVNAGSILTDREGNFWVSTPTGLRRLRQQIITGLSIGDKLNSNEVYPILETLAGDFYIGSTRGVNRYSGGAMTDLLLHYASLDTPLLMSGLWEDGKGRIWLGYDGGFGRLENGLFTKLNGNDIPGGVTDFTQDSDSSVWIATTEGIYKFKDDREIAHYTTSDGLPHVQVVALHFDRRGNLFAATADGLAKLSDGRFVSFNTVENSPRGVVRAIYEDADGVLWFGTYSDGLVRYKDGEFFNYRVEHGLFNNGVFAILEDRAGNLWMSSNRGIHRVSKQELNDFADGKIPKLNSVSYGEQDGMRNAECNGGRQPAAIKASDGKLWFATMGGVSIVDPEAETTNPNPPPTAIEDVSIDRKRAILNSASEIEIAPDQSSLEINYTALSLIKSNQIKFRYKLDGLDDNWVEAGTKRTANYSYLPAGSYTFRVVAANANGVWNAEGSSLSVIVHPYFNQTLWFRILAAMLAALGVGLIYRNRISHLREIADAKTRFSRQLIESQEAERKRIAAELHDGLGQNLVVMKNRAVLGLDRANDPKRVAKELVDISESASLALEEVREITNNLRPQLLDRLGLTKAITAMLKKVSGVIEVESEIDSIDGFFSEAQEISVYRIVQESINNVIKHSGAAAVAVRIMRTADGVVMEIDDDGRGFDPAAAKSGLGLIGLRERAQILNGELQIDSEIGKGTRVKVEIRRVGVG